MNRTINDFFEELNKQIESETNEKITKGIHLFINSDDIGRRVFLHGSGFSGELTAKSLRDHFDTLDLLDMIDMAIYDLEDNLPVEKN